MLTAANKPYDIVPIVSPATGDPGSAGKIKNLHVGGGVSHRQLVQLRDGRWTIAAEWRVKGWSLLEDLYVEEKNRAGWAMYQRYIEAMKRGTTHASFPASHLPKAVLARRMAAEPDEFEKLADEFEARAG